LVGKRDADLSTKEFGGLNFPPILIRMNNFKERPSFSRHQSGALGWLAQAVAEAVPASHLLACEEFPVWSIDRSI
jgi:hypothetical protein